ncbi:hypothetical protein Tco_0043585 [Tanacetum coccineum]
MRKTTTSVLETKTSISKTSKDIVEKPKTIRPSAPILEEWDTDSDNDSVFRPKSDQTKPKFTKINFVKSGENVKSVNKENTHRQYYSLIIVLLKEQVVTRVSAARVIYAVNTAENNEINTASIVRYRTKRDLVLGWIKGIVTTVSFKKAVTTVIVDYYC